MKNGSKMYGLRLTSMPVPVSCHDQPRIPPDSVRIAENVAGAELDGVDLPMRLRVGHRVTRVDLRFSNTCSNCPGSMGPPAEAR